MRGTGCSGGSFSYFEPLQSLDGYDVVEAVAAQPWVARPRGRDGRHLLPRHQPALRRSDAAAAPRRTRTALRHRRHLPQHAVSRRHLQQRLRVCRGRRTARTTASPTARVGSRASSMRVAPTARSARRTSSCGFRTPTSSQLIDEHPYYENDAR